MLNLSIVREWTTSLQPSAHSGNLSDAEHVSVGAASLSIGHAVEDSIEDFMYG